MAATNPEQTTFAVVVFKNPKTGRQYRQSWSLETITPNQFDREVEFLRSCGMVIVSTGLEESN